MKKISIVTWNVNSIRARMDNFIGWLEGTKPDIILLQETKCTDKDFPEELLSSMGYNSVYHGQKSYNGVAILSKYKIELESNKLLQNDEQARYIEGLITIDGKVLRVASVYVPQGGSDLEPGEKLEDSQRFKYKLEFFGELNKRMQEVLAFDECVVFGGDLNVAHNDIDLHKPKAFKNKVGFHPLEKEQIQGIIDIGYCDLFRKFYPEKQEYTWWDYRRGGWDGNRGWRIDYMMANKNMQNIATDCTIHRETRGTEKPSDHVPVEMIIEI